MRKAEGMTVTTSEPGTQRKRGTAAGAVRATTPMPSAQSAPERTGDASGAVRALVLGGYGLNCDLETQYALTLAGAQADLVHVNELIAGEKKLDDYHILALIGGFSWADDHGAGVILGTKLRHHLGDEILRFVAADRLVIGICNGFQALANLGLLPGFEAGTFRREVAVTYNDCGNFRNQWVHLRAEESRCVFSRGLATLDLPVRHAEGKFVASPEVLERLREGRQIVLRYTKPDGSPAQGAFPWNPNGSLLDIAGICDPSGRIFGLMPHPEAYNHFTNHPDWLRRKWAAGVRAAGREASAAGAAAAAGLRTGDGEPCGAASGALGQEGAGIALFRNAVMEARRSLA